MKLQTAFSSVSITLLVALLEVPAMAAEKEDLHVRVEQAIQEFQNADAGIQKFLDSAIGYAVFPTIGKGGAGIGGARGTGELLVGGKAVGRYRLTQLTVGFQFGGQKYSEIIFFQIQSTLDSFR